jgi:hypothetical protein
VVSPSELQKATLFAARVRQRNREQVDPFFASPLAQKALKDAHIESAQVKKAISTLSDEELAKIAARTQKAQKHAKGAKRCRRRRPRRWTLTLIVIAIAAVLIIVTSHQAVETAALSRSEQLAFVWSGRSRYNRKTTWGRSGRNL